MTFACSQRSLGESVVNIRGGQKEEAAEGGEDEGIAIRVVGELFVSSAVCHEVVCVVAVVILLYLLNQRN